MDWFRSKHGAPTDPKWKVIAKRANVPTAFVASIVWALFDRASAASDRGSIAGYDAEEWAVYYDMEAAQVEAIVSALRDKGAITGDRITSWETHQPKREDGAAERGKAYRERIAATKNATAETQTQTNANERSQSLDKSREEEKKESLSAAPTSRKPKAAPKYSEPFEIFWKAFPTDSGMSKSEAWTEWIKLAEADQGKAVAGVPEFKRWVTRQGKDYRTVHACRYLSKRRFDGFAEEKSIPLDTTIAIFTGTPAWDAWTKHRGGRELPQTDIRIDGQPIRRGWRVPTEFPPSHSEAA